MVTQKIQPLPAIELTEREKELESLINYAPDPYEYQGDFDEIIRRSCDAAASLMELLIERDAIPELRERFFTDPEFNIGKTKKSVLQVFESNGTKGDEIFSHPHFLKYLQYLIHGPLLPKSTIDGFCELLGDGFIGTSGQIRDALGKYARTEIRNQGLDKRDAAEQFFRLAVECGYEHPRMIRDAALSTR